jgi:hypothetical protein
MYVREGNEYVDKVKEGKEEEEREAVVMEEEEEKEEEEDKEEGRKDNDGGTKREVDKLDINTLSSRNNFDGRYNG